MIEESIKEIQDKCIYQCLGIRFYIIIGVGMFYNLIGSVVLGIIEFNIFISMVVINVPNLIILMWALI